VAKVPDVKRIVMVNIGGQIGGNMETVAQRIVNNEMDASLDMRDALIDSIIKKNPKVTSHTADKAPHGYLDWWPNSLWMNHQAEPYNDVRVRKALALAVNRDQIDEVVYSGAKISTVYPFPLYPGLAAFANSDGMKANIQKYNPRKFDLTESGKLMTEAGWAKNAKGLWEKGGKTLDATVKGFEGIHSDIVPVVVEQLKKAGFDAKIDFGPEAYNDMAAGKPGLYMFGHGASLKDPYAVLFLFTKKPSGNSAGANNFSRYNNPEFDKIVAQMGPMDASDPKFTQLAAQAFDIYYKDVIDIPLIQWLHRIPYNQTYWTNWPTAANLGPGVNGAFWAHTGALVVANLKAAS
jgi:ABC-type transport system substrate-binding protein